MSILSKLTIGAMAVLGAYALKGKGKNGKATKDRKALSSRAGDATSQADNKRASRRAKPKAGARTRAASSARPRAAKASSRKRTASRAGAKRTLTA